MNRCSGHLGFSWGRQEHPFTNDEARSFPLLTSAESWEPAGLSVLRPVLRPQMEFNEKELRREISYAIKNIHGIRQVTQAPRLPPPLPEERCRRRARHAEWPGGGARSGRPGLGSAAIARPAGLRVVQLEDEKRSCTPGSVLADRGPSSPERPSQGGPGVLISHRD